MSRQIPAGHKVAADGEWAGPSKNYKPCASPADSKARHWGPDGAAGCLAWVTGQDGERYVLLAKRSRHVQQGNTWAFPGGAIDAGETPLSAAIREVSEEVSGVTLDSLTDRLEAPCPHGCGWSYTTIVVRAYGAEETWDGHGRLANVPRVAVAAGHSAWETDVAAWIPLGYVDELPLHPAFAAAWPELRQMVERAS